MHFFTSFYLSALQFVVNGFYQAVFRTFWQFSLCEKITGLLKQRFHLTVTGIVKKNAKTHSLIPVVFVR